MEGIPIIIRPDTETLILGTFPGKISLQKQQYFANKINQFWHILSRIFDEDLVNMGYEERTSFLLQKKIGLWDTVKECDRASSSDNDILNEKFNDLIGLASKYPRLKKLVLAGKFMQSKKTGREMLAHLPLPYAFVPSPSPRYPLSIDEKIRLWKEALG